MGKEEEIEWHHFACQAAARRVRCGGACQSMTVAAVAACSSWRKKMTH
jgi:hypothetical protein